MLTQGELHALREAAERSWDDDTRHPSFHGHPQPSTGQCYVTASWLAGRLGGRVGHMGGHYVWVSPDYNKARGRGYVLDLTGDNFTYSKTKPQPGPIVFKRASHPSYSTLELVPTLKNDRAEKFATRANRLFDDPNALHKFADMLGDAYPAETPQAIDDMDQKYMHDDISGTDTGNGEFLYVYCNGSLEVSPFHTHEDLLGHTGAEPNHTGPMSAGTVNVSDGVAFWHAAGNISPNALMRVFKDYGKHAGWNWGGLAQADGTPIDDEAFIGKSSSRTYFAYTNAGELIIVHRFGALSLVKDSRITGALNTTGGYTSVQILKQPNYPMSMQYVAHEDDERVFAILSEWCNDQGHTLLSYEDNLVKPLEHLDLHNNADPNPTQPDDIQYPARYPDESGSTNGGAFKCEFCGTVSPTYSEHLEHQQQEETLNPTVDGAVSDDSHMPELRDPDNPSPSNRFQDQFPYVAHVTALQAGNLGRSLRMGHKEEERLSYLVAWRHGGVSAIAQIESDLCTGLAGKTADINALLVKMALTNKTSPQETLAGPLPFIYDIKDDTITTGQPGTKVSDIPGQFTPGGIVDGVYDPSGKCIIHTFTNMPWTANYFLKLWYSKFPTLEVKSLHLRDDGGGDTRLASVDWNV